MPGLTVTRKPSEALYLILPNGDRITATVVEVMGNRVRLNVVAPSSVQVLRDELFQRGEWREAAK